MRTAIDLGHPPDLESVLKLARRPEGANSLMLFKIVEASVHANLPVALALLAAGLPRNSQVMVLKAIGTSRSPMAFTAITRSANDMDAEVRAAAITALRALGGAGIVPWLVTALRDADWRVRLKAVEGLGQFGSSGDCASIEPLLNDSVWWIRFRAGEAMQRLATAATNAGQLPKPKRARGDGPRLAAAKEAGGKKGPKAPEKKRSIARKKKKPAGRAREGPTRRSTRQRAAS